MRLHVIASPAHLVCDETDARGALLFQFFAR
jgi:hypothetical protein